MDGQEQHVSWAVNSAGRSKFLLPSLFLPLLLPNSVSKMHAPRICRHWFTPSLWWVELSLSPSHTGEKWNTGRWRACQGYTLINGGTRTQSYAVWLHSLWHWLLQPTALPTNNINSKVMGETIEMREGVCTGCHTNRDVVGFLERGGKCLLI